jgi:hypothetical protein
MPVNSHLRGPLPSSLLLTVPLLGVLAAMALLWPGDARSQMLLRNTLLLGAGA